jgi:hypothetical protein
LTIDTDGVPHLKKQPAGTQPEGLAAFEAEVHARMPERHLLDILKYGACWTRYTRHFGPPSGADTKLARAEQRYILTVFGYGCNLGPSQTARHAPGIAATETLRRINAQHIDTPKLEASTTDLINAYARFVLPKLWGAGRIAIADGTHVPLRGLPSTSSHRSPPGGLQPRNSTTVIPGCWVATLMRPCLRTAPSGYQSPP